MSKRTGIKHIRDKIKKRENYRCFICGRNQTTGNPLHAHHLDEELSGNNGKIYGNNPLYRMVALCRNCHVEVHQRYRKIPSGELSPYLKQKMSWRLAS